MAEKFRKKITTDIKQNYSGVKLAWVTPNPDGTEQAYIDKKKVSMDEYNIYLSMSKEERYKKYYKYKTTRYTKTESLIDKNGKVVSTVLLEIYVTDEKGKIIETSDPQQAKINNAKLISIPTTTTATTTTDSQDVADYEVMGILYDGNTGRPKNIPKDESGIEQEEIIVGGNEERTLYGALPSDYKQTEQEAIRQAEEWQQSKKTPVPANLTEATKNAYSQLIQANPLDKKSQENIKEIKEKFGDMLSPNGIPFGELMQQDVSFLPEKTQKKLIQFTKALDSKIPDSLVTGKLIIQADPFKDTTLDTMKAKMDNVFKELKSPLQVGNSAMNISATIKNASEALSGQMGSMVSNMTEQLTDKVMGSVNAGLIAEQDRINGLSDLEFATEFEKDIFSGNISDRLSAIKKFQRPFFESGEDGEKPGMLDGVLNTIGCEPSQIGEALPGMFNDLLGSVIGNPLNVNIPSCASEQVIGAATNKVVNMIDSVMKPKLEGIEKALNFKLDLKDMLFSGVDMSSMSSKIPELNICGTKPPTIATNKFLLGVGPKLPSSVAKLQNSFNKILDGASIKNKISSAVGEVSGALDQVSGIADQVSGIADQVSGIANLPGQIVNQATSSFMEGYQAGLGETNKDAFEKEYGSWGIFGGATTGGTPLDNCNTGPVKSSGPPKIEAFGGGGSGLKAEPILGNYIDRLDPDDIFAPAERTASIVGARIIESGGGYTSPPIVTFDDEIGQGYGAYGKATIDQNPNSPSYGQVTSIVITSTGENYPASDEEDPLYIGGVVIDDPGLGYKDTDTLEDFELTVVNGQIVNVDVVNQKTYDDLPELNINTTTGFGAKLRPLLTLIPPEEGEVIQVIDCIGKV